MSGVRECPERAVSVLCRRRPDRADLGTPVDSGCHRRRRDAQCPHGRDRGSCADRVDAGAGTAPWARVRTAGLRRPTPDFLCSSITSVRRDSANRMRGRPPKWTAGATEEPICGSASAGGGDLWRNTRSRQVCPCQVSAWPHRNASGQVVDRHDCQSADVDRNRRPDAYCSAGRFGAAVVKSGNDDGSGSRRISNSDVGSAWGVGDPVRQRGATFCSWESTTTASRTSSSGTRSHLTAGRSPRVTRGLSQPGQEAAPRRPRGPVPCTRRSSASGGARYHDGSEHRSRRGGWDDLVVCDTVQAEFRQAPIGINPRCLAAVSEHA